MQSIASYNDFYLDAYLCAIRGYLRPNVYIRMKIFFGNIWLILSLYALLCMWSVAIVFITGIIQPKGVFFMLKYRTNKLVMGLIGRYAQKLCTQ